METAGWMRNERRSMSRISGKLRVVRILGLLLSGRCGTRDVEVSELWMSVIGGRIDKLVIVS